MRDYTFQKAPARRWGNTVQALCLPPLLCLPNPRGSVHLPRSPLSCHALAEGSSVRQGNVCAHCMPQLQTYRGNAAPAMCKRIQEAFRSTIQD